MFGKAVSAHSSMQGVPRSEEVSFTTSLLCLLAPKRGVVNAKELLMRKGRAVTAECSFMAVSCQMIVLPGYGKRGSSSSFKIFYALMVRADLHFKGDA